MKSHDEKGFTLLEVLIATTILGTAVVTLLGLHARNIRLAGEIADVTVAGMLTSQIEAATRIAGFPELGELDGTFRDKPLERVLRADFGGAAEEEIRPYGTAEAKRFRWKRSVEPTSIEDLRQVRVAILSAGDERVLAELWFAMRDR